MHNPTVAKRRLGIITAPGWMDPNAADLERLYPGQLHLQQTILPPPGFDYSFASIAASEPHLVTAAKMLADAGCEFIIQGGPGDVGQRGGPGCSNAVGNLWSVRPPGWCR